MYWACRKGLKHVRMDVNIQGPQSINPITVPGAKVVNAVCRTGPTLYDHHRQVAQLVWLWVATRVASAATGRTSQQKQFHPHVCLTI
jgi:hypothetical protein